MAISRRQNFNFNMNIRLPLFWSTRSRARGPDSATCVGLAHGRDYSDCTSGDISQWTDRYWIADGRSNYKKTRAHYEGFSTLTPFFVRVHDISSAPGSGVQFYRVPLTNRIVGACVAVSIECDVEGEEEEGRPPGCSARIERNVDFTRKPELEQMCAQIPVQ